MPTLHPSFATSGSCGRVASSCPGSRCLSRGRRSVSRCSGRVFCRLRLVDPVLVCTVVLEPTELIRSCASHRLRHRKPDSLLCDGGLVMVTSLGAGFGTCTCTTSSRPPRTSLARFRAYEPVQRIWRVIDAALEPDLSVYCGPVLRRIGKFSGRPDICATRSSVGQYFWFCMGFSCLA